MGMASRAPLRARSAAIAAPHATTDGGENMPAGTHDKTGKRTRPGAVLALLCLSLLLTSCAPQDISSSADRVDARYYGSSGPDTLAEMRYPTLGSMNRAREQYFYRLSQPTYFQAMQNWRMNQFRRHLRGIDPESPAYREKPRQRSPFRE